jgi:hypothetical protein
MYLLCVVYQIQTGSSCHAPSAARRRATGASSPPGAVPPFLIAEDDSPDLKLGLLPIPPHGAVSVSDFYEWGFPSWAALKSDLYQQQSVVVNMFCYLYSVP